MKKRHAIYAFTLLAASCSTYADNNHPSDELVMKSAYACLGIAQKHTNEGRSFPVEQVNTFLSHEVDSCVQLVSWSIYDKASGNELKSKIDAEWNRTGFNISDEQYAFYANVHRDIVSSATKASVDKEFFNKMARLGEMTASNNRGH
ncbi:hypothetical protein ACOJCY_002661 [Cronobacter dublinensis]